MDVPWYRRPIERMFAFLGPETRDRPFGYTVTEEFAAWYAEQHPRTIVLNLYLPPD